MINKCPKCNALNPRTTSLEMFECRVCGAELAKKPQAVIDAEDNLKKIKAQNIKITFWSLVTGLILIILLNISSSLFNLGYLPQLEPFFDWINSFS